MDEKKQRLDSLLRASGAAAKRETRALVSAGRISINGAPAESAAQYCSPDDAIAVDGRAVAMRPGVVFMMNKPSGFVCVSGAARYPSVFSLLRPEHTSLALFAVGRLDADTEGLLLLTNDGALCRRVARPETNIPKTYLVRLDRPMPPGSAELMRSGIRLENGEICRPAEMTALSERSVLITVTEGKRHEVKRLVRACGPIVASLRRLSIGALELDPSLAPGEYRRLSEDETALLFKQPVSSGKTE
ncbi:MAG: pseudouridine synthase [Oscillospiraceae bacterium]|nr:pseudouridine synthase [Oscillospiraceae bacterium]